MTLEEIISQLFKNNIVLSSSLATYINTPAVFLQSAPADTQNGWGETGQYPRIVYTTEMRTDAERKTAGTIRVDLLCDITGTLPEELEQAVRDCLKDLVVQPDNNSPYCFVWTSSQAFEMESNNADKRIVGNEMLFSILEYPEQITSDPDPVYTLNAFLKSWMPDAFVIGRDSFENRLQRATEDEPILYVRLVDTVTDRLTYGIAWMKCTLAIHIITPDSASRAKWTRVTLNAFAQSGETLMPDDSVMLFGTTRANNSYDYLNTGQVTVEATYSIPRLSNIGNVLSSTMKHVRTH